MVKRELARHTHPFLFSSGAISGTTLRSDAPFVRTLQASLNRSTLVFRHDAHRRGALVVRLEKAQLHMYNLSGKDLSGFSMKRAGLVRADLSGADLSGALLYRAKLEAVDLSDAKLTRCDLRESDLAAASLVRSDLRGALMTGANLRYADLRGASLDAVNLCGADLSDARLDADFDRATVVSDDRTIWPV